jgi:hypothetical protein
VKAIRRTKVVGQHGLLALIMRRLPPTKKPSDTKHPSWRLRTVVIIGAAIALIVGLSARAAYAHWSSSGGSVSGSAATGTLQPVTVAAFVGGDSPSSNLFPGTSADVILRVNNPNAYAVTLISVSGNGTIAADGGHSGCTTTGVTFTNQTGLTSAIGASGTTLVHLANAASMGATSSNGCQGATFSIPVSITVQK